LWIYEEEASRCLARRVAGHDGYGVGSCGVGFDFEGAGSLGDVLASCNEKQLKQHVV
jgi:hypothetical protein